MSKKYESECIKFYIEEGILYGIYLAPVLTLEVAQEVVKQRLLFAAGVTYPVLADIRNIKSVTSQARAFFAKPESNTFISAGALIVNNIFLETIGNIFIYLNKPSIPSRLFRNEQDAVKWLKTFL
ncbi:STAS/SEC14 domain-containing protein [Cytophaga hutchinsonii]|jgi:hypothetical protein|uniref:DUF7793 domain-containing protein n=1 Tax=Cytophaga hutchinsonii (strain ATCC 33406 / DSM 1761 / CIP 103989 / NBRC 15051 / NCIMB 9469 / D465) TaxID=269798 RepID=A0A6N4SRC5_CYTH3|nr:STAS/SEC14 domain-containing protein [Cytophaga hutchinsonii]ABG58943.1 hypothetical protein CHU_1675 [Cytophaga hutchinsonii ATCC 33406]SFX82500.1 hypothetical protein SAMN04487930_110144 [Cytophaga hutchinsonii ATCC 33406]